MRAKLLAAIVMALMMTVVLAATASALACFATYNIPTNTSIANGYTVVGNVMLNVSVGCNAITADGNATNVTFEYKRTDESTWIFVNATERINQSRPEGADGEDFYTRFTSGTANLSDSYTYQLRVTAYNCSSAAGTTGCISQQVLQDTVFTKLYTDNTLPQMVWITSIANNKEFEFPVTLTATARNASSCTFKVYDNDNLFKSFTGTMNKQEVGNERCSRTLYSYDFPGGIKRYVKLDGTDLGNGSVGANTTTLTVEYVGFQKEMSGVKKMVIDQDETAIAAAAQQTKSPNLKTIVIMAVLAFVIYQYVLKKRK